MPSPVIQGFPTGSARMCGFKHRTVGAVAARPENDGLGEDVFESRPSLHAATANGTFVVEKERLRLRAVERLAALLFKDAVQRFEKLRHPSVLTGGGNANAQTPRVGAHPLFKARAHRFEPGDVGADVVAENGVEVRASAAQGLLCDVFDKGAVGFFAVVLRHQEGAETDAGVAAAKSAFGLVDEKHGGAALQRGDGGDDPREARADDKHVGVRFLLGFSRSPSVGRESREKAADCGGRKQCTSGIGGHDSSPSTVQTV